MSARTQLSSPRALRQRGCSVVRHFQSKLGQAVATLRGLSSTRDFADGQRFSFRGLRGSEDSQAGLAGVGSKTRSYPKVIFFLSTVQQAPVCQAKQYVATRRVIQARCLAESPGWPAQRGWGCHSWSPAALAAQQCSGSVLDCELDSHAKFVCLKYPSLR